jgi:hypothetical protein
MGAYPGLLTRVTRVGLSKTSGWDALAVASFFTASPPNVAANTFDDLTSTAQGGQTVGTSAVTLAACVSAGTGAVGATGTSAVTLATIVSAGAGSTVTGTSAATLATIVSAGTGTAAGGSSAVTLSALTSTASGVRGAAGTSAATLATIVSAGAGSAYPIGSSAATLEALTSTATGTFIPVWTIIFDSGVVSPALYWSNTVGTAVNRADATAGTTKALQFPDISDSEETSFELWAQALAPDNILTIRYEVSSEEDYDFFRIAIDGVQVVEASGFGAGWQEYDTTLTDGLHVITATYSKDSSADDGDDTAYISAIFYPPGIKPSLGASTLAALTSEASGTTPTYPGLYRFWRIAALATQSVSGDTGLGEVELRGSIGGADLTDTLPGVATQQYGGPNDPNLCFDNDTSNYWTSGPEYEAVIWEFTTFPQDVQQVWIDQGEMLDIQIAASNDGVTWEWKAIQRGNTENAYSMATPLTIDLVGPNRHYDGYLGVNDLQQTDVFPIYCESDHIAVTAQTTYDPIRIEKLIAHSASTYPSPPIGAITYTFFCKGVIYSDDGGYPGTLIAETAEHTTLPNGQFFDLGLADWLFLMPGNYWFGVHTGGTSGNLLTHNTVGGQTTRTVARAYGLGVPATFPPGGVSLASGRPQPIYAVFPISTGESTLADATSEAVGFHGQAITGTAELILEALTSTAAGIYYTPVTGTAAALLDGLTSDAAGARGVFRPRVSLHGTDRPQRTLNATWVPR